MPEAYRRPDGMGQSGDVHSAVGRWVAVSRAWLDWTPFLGPRESVDEGGGGVLASIVICVLASRKKRNCWSQTLLLPGVHCPALKLKLRRHYPKGTYCALPAEDLADVNITAVSERRGKPTSARGSTAGWSDVYAVMLW